MDETGSHIAMARRYAWAPQGQRAYASKPRNRGRSLTMIGVTGVVATMSLEGGPDGDGFQSSVAQGLAPHRAPGHVVIMDNLKAHKVAGIRAAITATGAR